MFPDQVISIVNYRCVDPLRKELKILIKVAVLKGQFELMEALYDQTVKEACKSNITVADSETYQNILNVFGRVSHNLRKQLDHIATEERGPLTANEMHPDIDDTPEDWDEGKCIHNFVRYKAQGMSDTVHICTACGMERNVPS